MGEMSLVIPVVRGRYDGLAHNGVTKTTGLEMLHRGERVDPLHLPSNADVAGL